MPRNWRLPLTAESIEFWKKGFASNTSYSPESKFNTATIETKDYGEFFNSIEYAFNPLQLKTYIHYWDTCFGGFILEDRLLSMFAVLYDTSKLAAIMAIQFDTNGDGEISKDEFDEVMLVMYAHEPKVAFIDYKTFLEEADQNHDGKASVKELEDWLSCHLEAASG